MFKSPHNKLYALGAIIAFNIVVVATIICLNTLITHFTIAVLVIICGNAGFILGHYYTTNTRDNKYLIYQGENNDINSSKPQNDAASGAYEAIYLQSIIEELDRIQDSIDLLERYQCFIRMVESSLCQCLGPCYVSLWCPDQDYKNLIECVIDSSRRTASGDVNSFSHISDRRVACKVPLDHEVVANSLKKGEPYWVGERDSCASPAKHPGNERLHCDACIPLYRDYGQPVLINVVHIGDRVLHHQTMDFHSTVKLINIFWKQLQATNQREWLIEHDEISGALRDDIFIKQAQALAERCINNDENFVVVVIAIHGFRRIFTDNSRQWRTLSGILGRAFRRLLAEHSGEFLLGKMADDIFALLLPRRDEFITKAIMKSILARLNDEMLQDKAMTNLDIMAVELRWAGADNQQYRGNMEKMLNTIYRRLFCRISNKQTQIYQIILEKADARIN